MTYPGRLQDVLDMFELFDTADRTSMLLSYADQFQDVPPSVATRPFSRSHQVPHCESDAYVWGVRQPDGRLDLHFAVENPSGVSARALAVILQKTLSGLQAADVATVDASIVERLFRQNISMGKGLGLMSMVQAVQAIARSAAQDTPA